MTEPEDFQVTADGTDRQADPIPPLPFPKIMAAVETAVYRVLLDGKPRPQVADAIRQHLFVHQQDLGRKPGWPEAALPVLAELQTRFEAVHRTLDGIEAGDFDAATQALAEAGQASDDEGEAK